MMLRRNVLIFHQAALGDFILTWPIALAVARVFPQSRTIYVTAKSKGLLAEATLRVESTDVEAGWHRLFDPTVTLASLDANVQRLLASTHTAVVFGPFGGNVLVEALQRFITDLRVVRVRTDSRGAMHQADSYVNQIREHAILGEASQQILVGIRNRGIAFARKPQIDVLIHPGSGGPSKRWPPDRFVDLARRLTSAGRSCRFVIGEVEREQFAADQKSLLAGAAEVREPATYLDLLHEIAAARSYVGNDSGPTHLAAIIGTPTVAIFGPTDPVTWSPIGPNIKIVREQPIDSVSVKAVVAALEALPT